MNRPLRVVQIGAGGFSRANHAPSLRRLAEGPAARISLEAICDLDIERAEAYQRDFGYALTFTDLDEMIEEVQPDVVISMVQPVATCGVLEQVLPRGLPTLTEKPPGVTVPEAERLAELAEEHGNITYVAFNRRRATGIERLKRWGEENGPVRYVRAEMLRSSRKESGFAIGTGIHPIDCLRYLCGDVLEVETIRKGYAEGTHQDFVIRMHCEGGVVADLALLVDCGLQRERYMVHVENAMMEVTLGARYSGEYTRPGETAYRNGEVSFEDPSESDTALAGGFIPEHEAFLDAVEAGRLPDCCLQDARHSLRLSVAIQEGYSGPMSEFSPSEEDPYAL